MGKHTELISNPTFNFYAPPLQGGKNLIPLAEGRRTTVRCSLMWIKRVLTILASNVNIVLQTDLYCLVGSIPVVGNTHLLRITFL